MFQYPWALMPTLWLCWKGSGKKERIIDTLRWLSVLRLRHRSLLVALIWSRQAGLFLVLVMKSGP
jgi:hypothetical protein